MTNAELKAALWTRCPVQHMGMEYDYVSAVTYRREEDPKTHERKICISAALYDSRIRDEFVVHAKDIEPVTTS